MFWSRKKNDAEVTEEIVEDGNEEQKESSDKGPLHAMSDGDVVPKALSEKLAEIRGQAEPDYKEVEVDEEGNPIEPDEEVMDDEVSSGDADDSGDASDEEKSESADAEDASEHEQVELDPRLEAAGKAMGWDDDKIIAIAEHDISILEDLANRTDSDDTHRRDKEVEDKDKDKSDPADDAVLTKLKEKFGEDADSIVDALTKKIEGKFSDRFEKVDAFAKDSEERDRKALLIHKVKIADEVFDRHAKDFKEIGITKELPKGENGKVLDDSPPMKVRNEIYRVADIFHAADGGSFETAMDKAMTYYAGSQGSVMAARKVVKDLNDNRRRFSPKPTRRRMVRVYKDSNAKAKHIVQEAKRKAGVDK
jgi:hypothetical protein